MLKKSTTFWACSLFIRQTRAPMTKQIYKTGISGTQVHLDFKILLGEEEEERIYGPASFKSQLEKY